MQRGQKIKIILLYTFFTWLATIFIGGPVVAFTLNFFRYAPTCAGMGAMLCALGGIFITTILFSIIGSGMIYIKIRDISFTLLGFLLINLPLICIWLFN